MILLKWLDTDPRVGYQKDARLARPQDNMFMQVEQLFKTKDQQELAQQRLSRVPMTPGMISALSGQGSSGMTPLSIFMAQQAANASAATASISAKRHMPHKAPRNATNTTNTTAVATHKKHMRR